MDNFMDKLSQKLNAQEMIKANNLADTVEVKQLHKQIEQYDELLQEIRRLNLKNAEAMEKVNRLLDESLAQVSRLETIKQNAEEEESINLEEMFRKSDDYVHKENVKVYRNVQAVVVEETEKQAKKILDYIDGISNKISVTTGKLNKFSVAILVLLIANLIVTIVNCLHFYIFS